MFKSTQQEKKSKQSGQKAEEKSMSDYFSWTDDEVELLLNVAIDYKMKNNGKHRLGIMSQQVSNEYKEMYPTADDAEKLGSKATVLTF